MKRLLEVNWLHVLIIALMFWLVGLAPLMVREAQAGSVLPQQVVCMKYTQFAGDAIDNREQQTREQFLADLYENLPTIVRARLELIAAEAYAWPRGKEDFRADVMKRCIREAWAIQDPDLEHQPHLPPVPPSREPAPELQEIKSQKLHCDHARQAVHNMARDLGRDWTVERYYNAFERSIAEHVVACAKDPEKSAGKPLEDCVVRKCMGGDSV